MPYSNINFIKIQMGLLEDDRFLFDLNDRQKGLYLMLLALAGKTNNNIRNEDSFIKTRLSLKEIDLNDLHFISKIFHKFKLINGYWRFENFEEIHNYILRKSEGSTKEFQRLEQNKNRIRKEIEKKESKRFAPPTSNECSEYFKELKSPLEAEKFYDHFTANGWKVGGRTPMKDWRAGARNWVRRSPESKTIKNELPEREDYSEKVKQWEKESAPPPEEVKTLISKLTKK